MFGHASHDWSPHSWTCVNCACRYGSIAAQFKCAPSEDDSGPIDDTRPSDTERPEIDWFQANAEFSR